MTDLSGLSKTPLYDWHEGHGGKLVDFGGWAMPVQYTSIVTEHRATRTGVGLFDVSHMGRFRFSGHGGQFLERVTTRRVADMRPGRVRYSVITNAQGGTLDDVLVYHVPAGAEPAYWGLVVNAGNRVRIWDWLHELGPERDGVTLTDLTLETAMIAVQGPRAIGLASGLLGRDLSTWANYSVQPGTWNGTPLLVSRTGYTGEDGCEISLPGPLAVTLWERLLAADAAVVPVGLGARDTLRLEAAMPLYGHELTEEIDPLTAGLGFAVDLEGRQFPGRDVLQQLSSRGGERERIGLILEGKRLPRQGHVICRAGVPVGEVTSGTLSPTLDQPIAMGYVQRSNEAAGGEYQVDVRGTLIPAQQTPLPFYQRKRTH